MVMDTHQIEVMNRYIMTLCVSIPIVEVMNKKRSKVLDVEDCGKWFKNVVFTPE